MKSFVIMPFDKKYDDIFKIGIKQTAKELQVNAYRLDEELFEEGMLDKIYKEITTADFIIADLSDKNPNVFYELGFAHALGKICILITRDVHTIPFDLKHKRHIVYGNSIIHLQEQLRKNIEWAKKEIQDQKTNPFDIQLKSSGYLEKTDEYASAEINLIFDIENRSNKVSPEIQGVYLHSAQEWNIKQNGKNVSYRKSETKPYNYKYNLAIDIHKIPKTGWTQIEISASRIMARAWDGDNIQDSYNIQGHMLLEIETDKGDFKKTIQISLYLDTLPF